MEKIIIKINELLKDQHGLTNYSKGYGDALFDVLQIIDKEK